MCCEVGGRGVKEERAQVTATAVPLGNDTSVRSGGIDVSSGHRVAVPRGFFALLNFGARTRYVVHKGRLILHPIGRGADNRFTRRVLTSLVERKCDNRRLLRGFGRARQGVHPTIRTVLTRTSQITRSGSKKCSLRSIFKARSRG